MDKIVNTVKYRKLEKEWTEGLQAGKNVNVKITLDYEEVNKRPTGFHVEYIIGDSKQKIYLPNGG